MDREPAQIASVERCKRHFPERLVVQAGIDHKIVAKGLGFEVDCSPGLPVAGI
jgi:hypothetical protein